MDRSRPRLRVFIACVEQALLPVLSHFQLFMGTQKSVLIVRNYPMDRYACFHRRMTDEKRLAFPILKPGLVGSYQGTNHLPCYITGMRRLGLMALLLAVSVVAAQSAADEKIYTV